MHDLRSAWPRRYRAMWWLAIAAWGLPADHAGAATPAATFPAWVQMLGDDSFHSRDAASRKLLAAGVHGQDVSAVTEALTAGTQNSSMEIRLACLELLRAIRQANLDHQLSLLRNPQTPPESIELPGWEAFRRMVGSQRDARDLFARISTAHPHRLRQPARHSNPNGHHDLKGHGHPHELNGQWSDWRWDPYRMPPDDEVRWAVLLLTDLMATDTDGSPRQSPRHPAALSSRIAMALSNPAMGPHLHGTADGPVLSRLIGRWIELRGPISDTRSTLLIAMRYRCLDQANRLCEQTLGDRSSSASAVVTAMLSASVIGRGDLEQRLQERLQDQRTAHVWQSIAAGKAKIRTEVRDVAVALLLHRRGIDPRQAGFAELQADEIFVYRDHSLGFADDHQRQRTLRHVETIFTGPAADPKWSTRP